jgi:hypothetical protein
MSIEQSAHPADQIAPRQRFVRARRQGERTSWKEPPIAAVEDNQVVVAQPSPVTWPRIFPGI